ncbi:right-handed parallel beta-helix repeat-containing protein [Candidatus Chloroploca sp. M-50]|uniref:Right-handed parallel beta-helix repeat-containing protein n=1 Tax=Candidatus Chloroploca mongolica TaxID=2528176 RepID=A0ABS4DAL9_9CHLR|nr:right-handed parallel beta-helix repeat-containing protein [Candidatus Chloroploca mongolica]MBP1466489.1 right-handed parallel beta-helix repeat-containing protein [Candidatus Chloroploca mongolica]
MNENPCCPVCTCVYSPTEVNCPECNWELQAAYVLVPDTAEMQLRYERELNQARLAYLLRRVTSLEDVAHGLQDHTRQAGAELRRIQQQADQRRAQFQNNLNQIKAQIDTCTTALAHLPSHPSAPITVSPHENLAQAVADAPSGAEIHLLAGIYHLAQSLRIDKPLSLRGAGIEATRIVGTSEGAVLHVQGKGLFRLTELSVVYQGTAPASAVDVTDRQLEVQRCCFTGGVSDQRGSKRGGGGLVLRGQAYGTVADCVCRLNQWGIAATDNVQPVLIDNLCSANREAGIFYKDRAKGIAKRNVCIGNKVYGMYVSAEASPGLENNMCRESDYGIAYTDTAGGFAIGNTCIANARDAMRIERTASPSLVANVCNYNGWFGLWRSWQWMYNRPSWYSVQFLFIRRALFIIFFIIIFILLFF